jgi:hypothetical protein
VREYTLEDVFGDGFNIGNVPTFGKDAFYRPFYLSVFFSVAEKV